MRQRYLYIYLIIFVFLLVGCNTSQSKINPIAHEGVIDLSEWDPTSDGIIELTGEWEFYWEELLNPDYFMQRSSLNEKSYLQVPSYWGGLTLDEDPLSSQGYGTYRLTLHLSEQHIDQSLAIYLPDVESAYRLWVDGNLLKEVGVVGSSKETTIPRLEPTFIAFQPSHTEVTIIMQVSNFHHRNGGPKFSSNLGSYEDINTLRESRLGTDFFLIGGMIIAGLHHIILFFIRRKDRVNLFFGIFCLLIATRTSVIGEMAIYKAIPELNWIMALKMDYIPLYAAVIFFILFMHFLYPKHRSQRIENLFIIVISILILFVLFTPAIIFTKTIDIFAFAVFGFFIYVTYFSIKVAVKKEESSIPMLALLVLFAGTAVHDMLSYKQLLPYEKIILPFGLLFLVFSQSILLSIRYSKTFKKVEELSQQQVMWQHELEEKIQSRTLELESALYSLKDAQARLVEAEKMRSLGNLVAGVAHEINSPIGVTVTASSYFEDKLKEFKQLYNQNKLKKSQLDKFIFDAEETFKIIQPNLFRASELIRSFKQVAVDQSSDYVGTIKLKEYLGEVTYSLIPNTKKKNVNVVVQCDEQLAIRCNPGHISQIITNLIMNSLKHAFPDNNNRGEIKIKVRTSDQYIFIEYSDNGRGMDLDTQQQIFEPFFTTIRGQGGSGLGMHIVYNIVTQSLNGEIDCSSKLGSGTTFKIKFPITHTT